LMDDPKVEKYGCGTEVVECGKCKYYV